MEILNFLTEFSSQNWITVILSFALVMWILNFGTGKLEEELVTIGKKLKIPSGVRGATFDAISSSLPELFTVIVGLTSIGVAGLEIGIGTISGSAIFNILIIPFFSIIFYAGLKKISPEKSGINRDSIFYFLSILFFLVGIYYGEYFLMSVILILLYFGYIYVLILDSKKHKKQNEALVNEAYEEVKNKDIGYITIIYSLILLYIGIEIAVAGALFVSENLGISPLVSSLILLAAVSSVPDTLLSIKSAKRGMIDASLSNAVGSNIFNICIGLGLPIFIGVGFLGFKPEVNFSENFPIFLFVIASLIFYFLILQKKSINKKDSVGFLAFYLLFIGYLIYISI